MITIKEVAIDLTNFVLSNVNEAISFKPQLCYQVPPQDYAELRERYIAFTGTSMRKNKSKLYFLPTNISDELQQLNASIPDSAKSFPQDGHVYYKNRLITELDFENVKRVELACAYIAYATVNRAVNVEMQDPVPGDSDDDQDPEKLSPAESTTLALRRGGVIGFRELGYLVSITPWHFHRVFKVITGLTIREYSQLCSEFIKKNRDIMNACRKKVEGLKAMGFSYSCFDDPAFLKEGTLSYEPTENVVLLPEYFIDPNKSKEQKRKQKEAKNAEGKCMQRVEARKRRSSVMTGRIRRASQTSICSNSSIQDALHSEVSYPSTPQMNSPEERSDYSGHSESASPAAADLNADPLRTFRGSISKSRNGSIALANSMLNSLNGNSGNVGKVQKPRNSLSHRRSIHGDPATISKGLASLPLEQGLGNSSRIPTNRNSIVSPLMSPKIDFKHNMFADNLTAATGAGLPSDFGFSVDLSESVAPHALNARDTSLYSMGMPQDPTQSVISPPAAEPWALPANVVPFDDISLLANNENLAPAPNTILNNDNMLDFLTGDPSSLVKPQGTDFGTQAMAPRYSSSRNRVNSVAPEPDDLERMFLNTVGTTPVFSASENSQLFARDNTDNTTATSTTMDSNLTTETAATAMEGPLAQDKFNASIFLEDDNANFTVLSPVCSPTGNENGHDFPLNVPSTSFEALISNSMFTGK
ncbi:LAMI_0H11254g1_1 [Lachancea mirantina]|uniref:LAMI_0H11254g1_1 n=1 Tax=Lachancea mirantina TaxID=1230905 RepID=A0A1G4KHE3_9SACH|nr:LAMI_0H11254g1_1 [Lachancea mirantina]